MTRRVARRVVLTAAVLLAATVTGASAATRVLTWTIDGTPRRAIVAAPETPASSDGAPLLFVFHGAGDTADAFATLAFERAWPEAVVVYMDGLGRRPGQGGAFQTTDPGPMNRDLRFFDTALADLRTRYRIDDRRITVTGFSNGAKFAYLLWATRPGTIAALAPVAGMLAPALELRVPLPVLHIGGREDHQNEFTDQLASVEMAKRVNGAKAPEACGTGCTRWTGSTGAPVELVVHPGGHVWPQDAVTRITRFLSSQRRP